MDEDEVRRARERKREYQRAWIAANAEKVAAQKKAWAEAHKDEIREYRRAWKEANPEKHREHSRNTAARKRKKDEERAKAAERARKWAKDNPERAAAKSREWAKANPEAVKARQKRHYERNREAILARARDRDNARWKALTPEQKREISAKSRERINRWQNERRSTPEGRAAYNAYQNERRKRIRRLQELGLPVQRIPRSTKNMRAEHQAGAEAFFAERSVTPQLLEKLDRERRAVEQTAYMHREADIARVHFAGEVALIAVDSLTARLSHYVEQVQDRQWTAVLRDEIIIDSAIRRANGQPEFDADLELEKRIHPRIIDRVSSEARLRVGNLLEGSEVDSRTLKHARRHLRTEAADLIGKIRQDEWWKDRPVRDVQTLLDRSAEHADKSRWSDLHDVLTEEIHKRFPSNVARLLRAEAPQPLDQAPWLSWVASQVEPEQDRPYL